MLLGSPFDQFMCPEEEHSGKKVGALFERGRVNVLTIDFELHLWLRLFFLHQLVTLNYNYQINKNIPNSLLKDMASIF
jgi:hypothetical protein